SSCDQGSQLQRGTEFGARLEMIRHGVTEILRRRCRDGGEPDRSDAQRGDLRQAFANIVIAVLSKGEGRHAVQNASLYPSRTMACEVHLTRRSIDDLEAPRAPILAAKLVGNVQRDVILA